MTAFLPWQEHTQLRMALGNLCHARDELKSCRQLHEAETGDAVENHRSDLECAQQLLAIEKTQEKADVKNTPIRFTFPALAPPEGVHRAGFY